MRTRSDVLPAFFDEQTEPGFRSLFGQLLMGADDVAVAVQRIRLSSLDFQRNELKGLLRLRLLTREFNAKTLNAEAAQLLNREQGAAGLVRLLDRLVAGVIEVRVLPMGLWSPPFTVFLHCDSPRWVVTGAHRFSRPDARAGPEFGSLHGPDAAKTGLERFEALWEHAHDVRPALQPLVQLAERVRD